MYQIISHSSAAAATIRNTVKMGRVIILEEYISIQSLEVDKELRLNRHIKKVC